MTGLDALYGLPFVDRVQLRRPPGESFDWRAGTWSQILAIRGVAPDHDALAATLADIDRTVAVRYE